jgi:hypothetical protein
MNKTRISEIYHFDLNWRVRLDEDVLWLKIGVNDIEGVDGGKCSHNLAGNCSDCGNGKE